MTAHIDGDDYGPGPGDVDDSPEYHALRQFDGQVSDADA